MLFRLQMIEAYGTGIGRMRASYAESGLEVGFRVTSNSFTVALPNRNAKRDDVAGVAIPESRGEISGRILELLSTGQKSRRELQDALGVSQATILRVLGEMQTGDASIRRFGSGRSTRYGLVDDGKNG